MQLPTLQVSSQAVQQRQRGVGGRGLRCQARCFRAGGSRSLQASPRRWQVRCTRAACGWLSSSQAPSLHAPGEVAQ